MLIHVLCGGGEEGTRSRSPSRRSCSGAIREHPFASLYLLRGDLSALGFSHCCWPSSESQSPEHLSHHLPDSPRPGLSSLKHSTSETHRGLLLWPSPSCHLTSGEQHPHPAGCCGRAGGGGSLCPSLLGRSGPPWSTPPLLSLPRRGHHPVMTISFLFLFYMFIYSGERLHAGEGQSGRERENPKQALS